MLRSRKPNPNEDDPNDLMAIKIAEETIGDYKLKVSPDYGNATLNQIVVYIFYFKLICFAGKYESQNKDKVTCLTKMKQLMDCEKRV